MLYDLYFHKEFFLLKLLVTVKHNQDPDLLESALVWLAGFGSALR
jgi:hypothetical protein